MRHGFTAHVPYDMIMTKIAPHIKNKAKSYSHGMCQDVMHSIGCSTNNYKLGRTGIFLRPKNEMFGDLLVALDEDGARKIAHEVSERFLIRQRHSLSICFRFIGQRKSSNALFLIILSCFTHEPNFPLLCFNSAD